MDVLVSGVGTGGTLTGISRFFKQAKGKAIVSVAVEPAAAFQRTLPTQNPLCTSDGSLTESGATQ